MLWLYILLGILLLITLLLLLPIKIYASYSNDFYCVLYIGLLKFRLYPTKPKQKKKKSKRVKERTTEPKDEKTNLLKEKGLSGLIEIIKKIAELAVGVLKDLFKHIIIKKLLLSIKIAGKDAADTAIKYGECCSAVYPAISVITGAVNFKNYGVDISPDFNENAESAINFETEAKVFVLWLVVFAIKYGIKGIKLLLELKD